MSEIVLNKIKSERNLNDERNKLLVLQRFVRKLDRRLNLENEINEKNVRFFQLEQRIIEEQEKQKEKKREVILSRLQIMEAEKRKRMQANTNTNIQVEKIINQSIKKTQKEIGYENKVKQQREEQIKQMLKERKKALMPINFDEIDHHDIRYRRKMTERVYENENEDEERLIKMKRSRLITLQSEKRKMMKSAIDNCYENKIKEEEKLAQIKNIWKNRKQYGNRVQKQFHKNRVKTQMTEKDRKILQAQKKSIEIGKKNKMLKALKKPSLPFERKNKNYCKLEIKNIQKSQISLLEKIERLNKVSEVYENKFKIKGDTANLQNLSSVTLAKAEMMLLLEKS